MSEADLTKRIYDRLKKQVAFGGMAKRKTTYGEVILKCPALAGGQGDLEPLAEDLARIFRNYIEEEGLKQIKNLIKDMLR